MKKTSNKTLHTEICDILEIEYPVILAGMGKACGPRIAAAVSNAGGLGVLGASELYPEEIRQWIRKTRELTDKPFGVDILMPSTVPESGSSTELKNLITEEYWRFVDDLKQEYNVPDVKAREWPLTFEFSKSQFEVVLEEKVPVFASGLGTPDWLISEAHAAGVRVISLVGNEKNAVKVNKMGTDIIVAQGHEAGGHTGRIGSMVLIPQVVDAVSPTPVLAAGGISDGRGLAATLMMGAAGAWIGTAFLLTTEIYEEFIELGGTVPGVVDHYQKRMVEARESEARIFQCYTGKTMRALKNKFTDRWEQSGLPHLPMPLMAILSSDLLEGFREIGEYDYIDWPCGQNVGSLTSVRSASEVLEDIVDGAIQCLNQSNRYLN
ncbi:NAD(P)H-dependent flavin oxidoreductase [Thermodesulfobacteriota bacterium]